VGHCGKDINCSSGFEKMQTSSEADAAKKKKSQVSKWAVGRRKLSERFGTNQISS
jgi:hypothetical protein